MQILLRPHRGRIDETVVLRIFGDEGRSQPLVRLDGQLRLLTLCGHVLMGAM
jgi:hypothetical protein